MNAPHCLSLLCLLVFSASAPGQSLLNVSFGAGDTTAKTGFAATGHGTNDFWNLYSHYRPRYVPGAPLVSHGRLEKLRFADGTESGVAMAVTNAPGVWGNSTGDPMLDQYVFAPNGSNLTVTITGLEPGRYHIYAYGWAAADVGPEQNPGFSLRAGTNSLGPLSASGVAGWQPGQPWRERALHVVFRDVPVAAGEAVVLDVIPGLGGVAVLNGLQVLSRGTGAPKLLAPESTVGVGGFTNLLFREIRYEGRLDRSAARFKVTLDAESQSTNGLSAVLFEGDLALMTPKLPSGWRLLNEGRQFILCATEPGTPRLEFELVARVTHAEPWNRIQFRGPAAAIATVVAESADPNVEVQLQSGTPLEKTGTARSSVHGVLGMDRELALRWQSRTAQAERDTLVTADSQFTARLTPTIIRHTALFRCEVLQARLSQLRLRLPPDHVLTKLSGDQVRDWRLVSGPDGQDLVVDFVRPMENAVSLTLTTEQPLPALPGAVTLGFPQPLGVQRESGSVRVEAEDIVPRLEVAEGLRQVNASAAEFAAFRFNARPARLKLQLARIEPKVQVQDRVHARLEESRWLITHDLNLNVTQAGIYGVELTPQAGFLVGEVKGEEIDDWTFAAGTLRVGFTQRLLGDRTLRVQLEQSLPQIPPQISVRPLGVTGATYSAAVVGASSAAGIQLKTASLDGAREIPVSALPERREALLAFSGEGDRWQVTLAAERLQPRVVADVLNLVTVGDGLVGGSATIRFGIVNQGVQQFRVRLPKHWRNIEFTGPNIRRRDLQDEVWTLALQDKAWGGYTLVVTYDYAFDPKQATLDVAGAHPLDVERESGTTAITSAGNLAIEPLPIAEPLRPIDPTEIAPTDRVLISRPVLLAYRYEGAQYALSLRVTRHAELPVLDAVADRAQLTSVLTAGGEMLTQASFLVKNNERQFQEFRLPKGATLWGAAVNGEPVKADRDGDWVLLSLPRAEDRDQVFAVDLKYAQQFGRLGRWVPSAVTVTAPETRVPGTYVEWELYLPTHKRVSGFGGNLTVARDTRYELRDAWQSFVNVYKGLWHEFGPALIVGVGILALVVSLVVYGRKRGFSGAITVLAVFTILAILLGMMLPSLAKAKAKSQSISSLNNLKQIAIAARLYAGDNDNKFPSDFESMMNELGTPKTLIDPGTGQRYTYVGAGKNEADPNAILAFSSEKRGRREVAFADGHVEFMTEAKFIQAKAQGANRAGQQVLDARMMERYGLPSQAAAERPTVQAAPGAVAQAPAGAAPPEASPAAPPTTPPIASVLPTATGIKSLRIEVPKAGRPFAFTRVLSLAGEPPTIRFSMMSMQVFLFARTVFQVTAFMVGLLLVWFQWRAKRPRTFWLAVGLALTLVGLVSCLLAWRVLDLAFIVAVPALLLGAVFWMGWRLRRGRRAALSTPAHALAALLVWLHLAPSIQAAEVPALSKRVSIVTAAFTGETYGQAAQLQVAVDLQSTGTNQSVVLFGPEVAVQAFTATAGQARIWREGENVGVFLPNRGAASVNLRLLVKLGGDASRRQLAFALPPALGSRLTLALDEPDADVDFPSAVAFTRTARGTNTVIEAVLGATPALSLSWTPRVKRATEVAATVFASQTALVTVGDGVAGTRTIMEWQVSQGELQQLRLTLPDGHRLLRVAGDSVRAWDFEDTNRTTLRVELVKPMAPSVQVVVTTEKPLDALPAAVEVRLPRALDVKRETGMVAVRSGEELGLTVGTTAGLERIDNAEFAKAVREDRVAVFNAWRFLRPDFDLVLKAEMLRPKLEVTLRNQFRVDVDQLALVARADYVVSRAGVFAVQLELPRQGRVDAVICDPMQTWTERQEGGRRVLEVALKQRTLGALPVEVRLSQPLTNLPPILELTGAHAPGVEKTTGFVIVSAEAGVGLKTASLDGATEIPSVSVPGVAAGATGVLTYKYLATTPQAVPPWRLSLATEQLEPWVRAEVAGFLTVGESLVNGRATVRYEIQNAPIREFRLRVPAAWRNVEISGSGVRRRDQTDGVWRIELQAKVCGDYRLSVAWEQPRHATDNLDLAGLEVVGVERETGAIGLYAQGQLQLAPQQTSEQLLRIDARELPDWAKDRPAGAPALSYRYVRPGWQLVVEARRFEEAAVLQALAEKVGLRTVVADDGQWMTQLEVVLRNNGRQSLAIALPDGATVWSAFVDGQPVRPAQQGDRLWLPLERTGADDAPIPVELTYVGRLPFPRRAGHVQLASPRLDVPLKDARWELFLPPEYTYDGFKGTMSYESADLVPITQDFTLAEYNRQEISKQVTMEAQTIGFLNKAQNDLATHNFGNVARISELKGARALRGSAAGRELDALEKRVNDAQSSNLILAQNTYAEENARKLGNAGAQTDVALPEGLVAYDKKVAEQQVAQLQKSQAVAVTRVTPLRVNLPTRGLRHAFVQVLQTEVDKPLTIGFSARNDRDAGWIASALRGLGAFIGLWILAGLAVIFRSRPSEAPQTSTP